MMKKYSEPTIHLLELQQEDILTMSDPAGNDFFNDSFFPAETKKLSN